jgi:hypothetical protein
MPVPIRPSRLENHCNDAPASAPSSGSVPWPWKLIDCPSVNSELFAGRLIDAVGRSFPDTPTVIETVSESVAFCESVAVSRIV